MFVLHFKSSIFKIPIMVLVVFKNLAFIFIILSYLTKIDYKIDLFFSNAMLVAILAFRFRINDRILEINELNVKYMGEREFNEYLDKLSTISTIKLVSTKSLLLILVG